MGFVADTLVRNLWIFFYDFFNFFYDSCSIMPAFRNLEYLLNNKTGCQVEISIGLEHSDENKA